MQIFDKLRLLLKAELKITLFFEKIRIKKNTNFCYVIFIYVCVTVLSKHNIEWWPSITKMYC